MIESLLDFKELNKKPYMMFLWAVIIGSVSVIVSGQLAYRVVVSNVVFDLTGIFAVLFTVIPSIYFITNLIKSEELLEEQYIKRHYEKGFWMRHEKDLSILLFFFAGLTVAFAVWSMVLPDSFFQIQVEKINQIHGVTGSAVQFRLFNQILSNNLQVMFFSFAFSFLFGAGAVFIIVWNASILGVYIGELSKSVWEVPIVGLAFLPHGLPEIAGYLCAGLAGGLLSAVILRKTNTGVLKSVFMDSLRILIVGAFLIFIAAGIEVYL